MLVEASQPSYQADSRVSPSRLPENDSAVKTNGGCGQSTLDSFGKPTPLGLLLRMLPLSPVFQSSGKYTQTLEPKVMKSGFCIYELRMSGRRTSGQDVSLLPTPTANLFKNQKVSPCRVYSPQPDRFKRLAVEAAKIEAGMILLPTPNASLAGGIHIRNPNPSELRQRNGERGHGIILCAALAEKGVFFLPTPLASINDPIRPLKAKEKMRHTKGAKRFGKMLPGSIGDAMPSLIGKTIHPLFVEWMMGFPSGWTEPDCKLSAMQLCQDASIQSLKPSEELREVSAE